MLDNFPSKAKRFWTRIIGTLALILLLAFTFAPGNFNAILILPLERFDATGSAQPEVGIVLGAGLKKDGQLTDMALERLHEGIAYYKKTGNDLVFSGGVTPYGIESEQMYQQALRLGYQGQHWVEVHSTSTYENAYFSDALLDEQLPAVKTVTIITSPFHTRRAEGVFAKVMPERKVGTDAPSQSVVLDNSPVGRWKGLHVLLREYAAVAWYSVSGKM